MHCQQSPSSKRKMSFLQFLLVTFILQMLAQISHLYLYSIIRYLNFRGLDRVIYTFRILFEKPRGQIALTLIHFRRKCFFIFSYPLSIRNFNFNQFQTKSSLSLCYPYSSFSPLQHSRIGNQESKQA